MGKLKVRERSCAVRRGFGFPLVISLALSILLLPLLPLLPLAPASKFPDRDLRQDIEVALCCFHVSQRLLEERGVQA